MLSEQVSRQGFAALSQLNSLQEFLFPLSSEFYLYDGPTTRRRDHLQMCFELLPQLHVAAYKLTTFYGGCPQHVLSTLTSQILSSITVPLTLQLRILALDSLNTLPQHISLSHVCVLYLKHPDLEEDPISRDRFPNLNELNMHSTYEYSLMNVVRHGVGLNLRTLRVSLGEILRLDRLLDACPGLCELYMSANTSPRSESPLRPDTLQNLHTLFIACPNASDMQPRLMMEIFRLAQNLRSVELVMVPMAEEDLQELTEMVRQGTGLRKLESFKFYRKILVRFTSPRENNIRNEAIRACGNHLVLLKEFVFFDCFF